MERLVYEKPKLHISSKKQKKEFFSNKNLPPITTFLMVLKNKIRSFKTSIGPIDTLEELWVCWETRIIGFQCKVFR